MIKKIARNEFDKDVTKMTHFKWRGIDKNGQTISNMMYRESLSDVRLELIYQNIQPLSIIKVERMKGEKGKIDAVDIMFFSRQMATMLTSGLSLSDALNLQSMGIKKYQMRHLILQVKAYIDEGKTFSSALSKYPKVFNNMYQGLIAAGEMSGNLDIIFAQLADHQEKMHRINAMIKKAFVYPLLVIFLALMITAGILVFVIPIFQEMFESAGKNLPVMTQFVIDLSDLVRNWHTSLILFLFILMSRSFYQTFKKMEYTKILMAKYLLKIPFVGRIIMLSNCAVFARTLSILYISGIPILSALSTSSATCSNIIFQRSILNVRENVLIGQQLNFAMRQTSLFPEIVIHMVGIGEKSGNLGEMLLKVALFFELEIENTIASAMTMIEPFLMVILGGLIGGLVIAMYLPIFDLASGV